MSYTYDDYLDDKREKYLRYLEDSLPWPDNEKVGSLIRDAVKAQEVSKHNVVFSESFSMILERPAGVANGVLVSFYFNYATLVYKTVHMVGHCDYYLRAVCAITDALCLEIARTSPEASFTFKEEN